MDNLEKFIVGNFTGISDEDLRKIAKAVSNEQDQRYREKRSKLVDDFKQAFYALHTAGIDVSFAVDGDYEYGEEVIINNFDAFIFC